MFDAALTRPRQVLQRILDEARRKAQSEHGEVQQNAVMMLHRYGDTVENWVANGWTVAEIPASEFRRRQFVFDPTEPDGHINVLGDYDLHKADLATAAAIVALEDLLSADG